jgi:hypothetical protein
MPKLLTPNRIYSEGGGELADKCEDLSLGAWLYDNMVSYPNATLLTTLANWDNREEELITYNAGTYIVLLIARNNQVTSYMGRVFTLLKRGVLEFYSDKNNALGINGTQVELFLEYPWLGCYIIDYTDVYEIRVYKL